MEIIYEAWTYNGCGRI